MTNKITEPFYFVFPASSRRFSFSVRRRSSSVLILTSY
ncbi:hypothetical protein HMPREF7215_0839 [Pyramidobacter piscolens W5455]|uniref:Uncharacterized protein n=1 Tax=Pyramidobacter piscolens W5455 TaxID=352165 RepID=A0ABP2HPT3_9BACT|nr:hypothetical protein HMPREF7215_0839 [Pyramidobacter piscolens W5455]